MIHDTKLKSMSRYFTRERFGSPQFLAGLLLLAFLAQGLWFCSKVPLTDREIAIVLEGRRELQTGQYLFHNQPSPVTGLLAALPLVGKNVQPGQFPDYWRWLVRFPFMIFGVLFGGSIWYVARRLFGNIAGYIALVLYAFSPPLIIRSSTVGSDIIVSWGAFGIIFTAIGVAHTLYAPREVVLWNLKRILLLGIALGVACAAQLSVALFVPVAFLCMWYLVPERLAAAALILASSCVIGIAVLLLAYNFHPGQFHAYRSFQFFPDMYVSSVTWSWLGTFFFEQPAVTALLLASIFVYTFWKRARFFGTTAPLILFAFLIALGIAAPHHGGISFYVAALPFGFVFIAGVCTDLLESRYASISFGVIVGVLLGHVLIGISGLMRI
jgi:hypothetical protein